MLLEPLNFAKFPSISQLILRANPTTIPHKTYKSNRKINSFKLQQQNITLRKRTLSVE